MSEPLQTFGHHFEGQDVLEGDIVERRNPADEDKVVAKFHNGTPDIADRAVDSADRAFEKWADTTPSLRGEVLFNAAVLLRQPEWRARFVNAMVAEIGKTAGGANGEVTKTFNVLRYMSGLPTHGRNNVYHGDQAKVHMYDTDEPAGVAALVTPFNFPLAVTAWKLAAVLGAGCTAVVKPSPAAPITTALIVELFEQAMREVDALRKANIGPGVINIIHGGPDVVSALIANQLVKALSFTGSTPVGKELLRQAIARDGQPIDPRHLVFEMGGDNAILVLADADLKMAVSAAVTGVAIGEGQRCTATKRILVDEAVADEFIREFVSQIEALKVGPGSDPQNDVGPLFSRQALDAVMAAVEGSQRNGMELLHGGTRLTEGTLARGNFMNPTILKGDPKDHSHLALRREVFGPVGGIGIVKGLEEGIQGVNDNTHRHVAGVFTRDLDTAAEFVRRAKAGMVHVNNSTLGGDVQARFGGLGGDTSFGPQEMGPNAMEPFLKHKTVGINNSGVVLGGRAR